MLAGLVGLVLDVSLGVVALVVALVYAVFAIVRSRSMIAGITHAQPLGPDELRPLRRLVENVSIGAGLPVTPELRIVDDAAPNAFAAGLRPSRATSASRPACCARCRSASSRPSSPTRSRTSATATRTS